MTNYSDIRGSHLLRTCNSGSDCLEKIERERKKHSDLLSQRNFKSTQGNSHDLNHFDPSEIPELQDLIDYTFARDFSLRKYCVELAIESDLSKIPWVTAVELCSKLETEIATVNTSSQQ